MTAPLPIRVCPICSAPHAACVPSNPQHVVDVPTREARRPVVAELHQYEVQLRHGVVTTMKMSAEDAKLLYGDAAKKVGTTKPGEVQPVSRPVHATNASDVVERPELPEDEAQPAEHRIPTRDEHLVTSQAKKAEAPQNKARQTSRRG